MSWWRILLAVAATGWFVSGATASEPSGGPDCAAPEACARILQTHAIGPTPPEDYGPSFGLNVPAVATAMRRLVSFGDDGVVALLPLLDHPNAIVRNRAGYTLNGFGTIDPRHLPTLRSARQEGRLRLMNPDAAPAGTDDDLAALWRTFLAGPDAASDQQTFAAIVRFGDRAEPLVRGELELCRQSRARAWCARVSSLAATFRPLPLFALDDWEAIARSPLASDEVRRDAAERLVSWRHPYGLVALSEQLAELAPLAARYRAPPPLGTERFQPPGDLGASSLISRVGPYGESAAPLGPLLLPFAQARGLEYARAEAIRVIGQIGYKPAAAALIAQAPEFEDNWEVAYETAEALGRLGAGEAQLEALAANHWYKPVRNNAERALNLLHGGEFARPGVVGDVDHPWFSTTPDFRYLADHEDLPSACVASVEQTYYQLEPRRSAGPGQRRGPVALSIRYPDAAAIGKLSARYPGADQTIRGRTARVPFIVSLGDYRLVGTNAGEFGGGVEVIGPRGERRRLLVDNAIAVFRHGDGLVIATGLSHGSLNGGDLWFVSLGKAGPELRRRIRLPTTPYGFTLAYPETLVVRLFHSEVALTSDGRLIDPARVAGCQTNR
jgi:HEAT repeat protein